MRKNALRILLAGTIGSAPMAGYDAASSGIARSSAPQQTQESAPVSDGAGASIADAINLTGYTLMIYCGADTTKPLQGVADGSESAISCEMNVVYANTGQTQSQITTSEEGDMLMAGPVKELKPVGSYVSENRALVKCVPVLAVQSNNPKNTTSLSDLATESISLIISDADFIPIGEIAKRILSNAGILDKVQIAASTTTAPQVTTAIAAGGADAAIIWREDYNAEGVEIVDNSGLEGYIKTIPAASLTYSTDRDARQVLLDYLNLGEAREIWIMYEYETAE